MVEMECECDRIAILGACVNSVRSGNALSESLKTNLENVQKTVTVGRERQAWRSLQQRYALSSFDQDILACVIAPEVEPRIGWLFQEMQIGVASPYPTPALIQELFFLKGKDARASFSRLLKGAPLCRAGLIQIENPTAFQPLQPTTIARKEFLGFDQTEFDDAPPGTIEVPVKGTLDDLVLPDYCLKLLDEFMLWVTHRKIVEQTWKARLRGGPVALFAGPSGVGKTFAAEVVAHTLGLQLYQVDLGALISKYVGETERNLNALFKVASRRLMLLLFDEADALFGKRGDVRDARDRYANMEVSHLLSRIETHSGPCVLTTNMRDNIDPAFARRFQVIIDFPRPSIIERGRLWQIHLPVAAPRASDVDPVALGRAVELTGGQIRNAALHAAFLAAGEVMPITLGHIASAVRTELSKDGSEFIPSNLGILSEYLRC